MTKIKITKELILNLHSLNLSKKQVATHLEIPISILTQGLEQLQLKKLKFNKEDLETLPDLELPEVINTHTFTMYEEEPVAQIQPVYNALTHERLETALNDITFNGVLIHQGNSSPMTTIPSNWSVPITSTPSEIIDRYNHTGIIFTDGIQNQDWVTNDTSTVNFDPNLLTMEELRVHLDSLGSQPLLTEEQIQNLYDNERILDEVDVEYDEVGTQEWEEGELEDFLAQQHDRDREERENHDNWLAETTRQEERERERFYDDIGLDDDDRELLPF